MWQKVKNTSCIIKEPLWTLDKTTGFKWNWMKTYNYKLLPIYGVFQIILCNQLRTARRACQFSVQPFSPSQILLKLSQFFSVSSVVHASYVCSLLSHFSGISLAEFATQIWYHWWNIQNWNLSKDPNISTKRNSSNLEISSQGYQLKWSKYKRFGCDELDQ